LQQSLAAGIFAGMGKMAAVSRGREKKKGAHHPGLDRGQQEQLLTAIEKHRLGRLADSLLTEARPQLSLRAGKLYKGAPRLGRSRLGGAPDLPPGTAWPEVRGQPLIFMAQIRFDELPIPRGWPLPRKGLLSVFMGDDEERFQVEHSLIYTVNPGALVRLTPPELGKGARHEHLRACPISAAMNLTLPSYGEHEWKAFELDEEETDRYFALQESLSGGVASLLGRDYDVDQLPTERLAIKRLGGPAYDYKWEHKNIARIRAEAQHWVPLFQMDSNFDIGLCMWDAYTFVVLIRWEDLLGKRFDRTQAHLARC
jgi:uncharacterized protein YwqG